MTSRAFSVRDDFFSNTLEATNTDDIRDLENNEIGFVNGQLAFMIPALPAIGTTAWVGIGTVVAFVTGGVIGYRWSRIPPEAIIDYGPILPPRDYKRIDPFPQ